MSKRIVGIVIMIWSLLIIAWASMLVYDLSSPNGPIMVKRDAQPVINEETVARRPALKKPFRRG